MVEIGAVLEGRFRVDAVMGAGGMGIVLAATQLELGRSVCLKLMHARVAATPGSRERFEREARIASRLRSEHVCCVHDVFVLADGTPCIAMERIDGNDLAAEVGNRGPLPIVEAMMLVEQACTAMAEAHALGIVHRDLKPHNLLLSRRIDGSPQLKVVDFGLAAAIGDAGATTGALGSPSFMAPEQARRGRTVDARADVYSLGAVLYYLVTGRPPFVGGSALDVLVKIQTDAPVPPSRLRRDLPAPIEAIIMRCLQRRPERRFSDAAALAAALATVMVTATPNRRRGRLAGVLVATTLSLAAATSIWSWQSRSEIVAPTLDLRMSESLLPRREVSREERVQAGIQVNSVRKARIATTPRSAANAPDPPPSTARCRTDDFLCQFGSAKK